MEIVSKLAKDLEISVSLLALITKDAPKKYKVYKIPKRTSGFRIIAQPTKQIKEIQRALIPLLEPYLPVHKAAFAYKKNISIKNNALMHANSKYMLKMDFSNFFNSITPDLFINTFEKNYKANKKELNIIKNILFWNPSKKTGGYLALSVGAPTSPFVSNAICYEFDSHIEEICNMFQITYTRYADDLTFSTNFKGLLFPLEEIIRINIKDFFMGKIDINQLKTKFTSKAHNRHVTGITISNDGELSLGRNKKRYIKHLIHQFKNKKLNETEEKMLTGLLSYAKHIEPKFIDALRDKYGNETIINLLGAVKIEQSTTL